MNKLALHVLPCPFSFVAVRFGAQYRHLASIVRLPLSTDGTDSSL